MARKSQIVRNNKNKALVARYAEKREQLVAVVKNPHTSSEEKVQAQKKLAQLPRSSSATRIRNRCALTGRARGYMGFFDMSRLAFRELALKGVLPGIKKTSW